ncbi:metallophosphoesterase family protein [Thermodesulforhabdus norvegica]|uniref:Phosphoesterase n=1 Tax=Thermodesulforhabdus norvegica TaxID=39841 RepID=A0A1I4V6B2_9BACT|nr:metallophosphoesterase family protein [Thermodesulforhabdus norvegica]SFM96693.1 hypothetical protein SAMN05660836_02129 [Thermodesulforhabdus norvegica]
MRIVVVSDTHLSTVTSDLKQIAGEFFSDADLVIHLGDWESIDVYNYLKKYPLIGVAGNADPPELKKLLPYKRQIKIGGYRLGIIHGHGASFDLVRRLRKEFTNVDAVLFGHTHEPYQSRDGGIWWVNPGSLFMGRSGVERSLVILTLENQIKVELVLL